MWSHLAKSITTSAATIQTPGKLMAKLGEVVAPPALGDDDDDDDYEEEYEEEYQEEYEDDEGEDVYEEDEVPTNDFASRLKSAVEKEESAHSQGSGVGKLLGGVWKNAMDRTKLLATLKQQDDDDDDDESFEDEEKEYSDFDGSRQLVSEKLWKDQTPTGYTYQSEAKTGIGHVRMDGFSTKNIDTQPAFTNEENNMADTSMKQHSHPHRLVSESMDAIGPSFYEENDEALTSPLTPNTTNNNVASSSTLSFTEQVIPMTLPNNEPLLNDDRFRPTLLPESESPKKVETPTDSWRQLPSKWTNNERDRCDILSTRSTIGDEDIIRDTIVVEDFINDAENQPGETFHCTVNEDGLKNTNDEVQGNTSNNPDERLDFVGENDGTNELKENFDSAQEGTQAAETGYEADLDLANNPQPDLSENGTPRRAQKDDQILKAQLELLEKGFENDIADESTLQWDNADGGRILDEDEGQGQAEIQSIAKGYETDLDVANDASPLQTTSPLEENDISIATTEGDDLSVEQRFVSTNTNEPYSSPLPVEDLDKEMARLHSEYDMDMSTPITVHNKEPMNEAVNQQLSISASNFALPLLSHDSTIARHGEAKDGASPSASSRIVQTRDMSVTVDEEHPMSDYASDIIARKEAECTSLQSEISALQEVIATLQLKAEQREEAESQRRQLESQRLREQEIRLLESSQKSLDTNSKQLEQKVMQTKHAMEAKCEELKNCLEQERVTSSQQESKFKRLLEEATARANTAERERKEALNRQNTALSEIQKRSAIAVERSEVKAARAMSLLDEKEEEARRLKTVIVEMRNTLKQNEKSAEEVEEEVNELHHENEELRKVVSNLEKERQMMQDKIGKLEDDYGKLPGLQMEVHMLKEARDRDREKIESVQESHSSTEIKLAAERDAAQAEARDLEQQLAAVLADLDIAKSDYARAVVANSNLQGAIEAFQVEREAEIAMFEEHRAAAEAANAAAHAAAVQHAREANERLMNEVENASNKAVTDMINELQLVEKKVEVFRKENITLRRSLDEAIHTLQTNQEDVIDRSLIKNILLDWHSKSGKSRRDVLILMASVLHFTDEDKVKCGIGEGTGGTIGSIVGAVAGPLPPAARSIDRLEGDSVREKWVSFLLAEAGEDDEDTNSRSSIKQRSKESTTI